MPISKQIIIVERLKVLSFHIICFLFGYQYANCTILSFFFFGSVTSNVSFSLSLSHTHTHAHTHILCQFPFKAVGYVCSLVLRIWVQTFSLSLSLSLSLLNPFLFESSLNRKLMNKQDRQVHKCKFYQQNPIYPPVCSVAHRIPVLWHWVVY